MRQYEIKDEYIDRKLGRRIGVGERLEISDERMTELAKIGVRASPIMQKTANEPTAASSESPKAEKAVKSGATRSKRA